MTSFAAVLIVGLLVCTLKLIQAEKRSLLVLFSCITWLVVALYLNYYLLIKD